VAHAAAARKRASRAREQQDSSDTENEPPRQRFRGVTECKNFTHPYQARCRLGGRKQSLGVFKTAVEAARAYDAFARAHGRTELNFSDEHLKPAPTLHTEPHALDDKPPAGVGTSLDLADPAASRRRQPLCGRRQQAGQSSADLSAPMHKLVVRVSAMPPPAPSTPAPVFAGEQRGSAYRGVRFDSRNRAKPWSARCTIDGKKYYIGPHLTEEESARCYDQFLIDLGREPVNFPVDATVSDKVVAELGGKDEAAAVGAQLLDSLTAKGATRAASERPSPGKTTRWLRDDEAALILFAMQSQKWDDGATTDASCDA
jgi:hypothetical protein